MDEIRTFRMAFGRGAYYSLVIGSILEFVMVLMFLRLSLWMGIGFLVLTVGIIWLSIMSFTRNRYEVTASEIVVCMFGNRKKRYSIEKISEIQYVDMGTDWTRTPPNARYQLELHFDRKYLKSVEPIYFAPQDRDAFVDCLLKINPNIAVGNAEVGR